MSTIHIQGGKNYLELNLEAKIQYIPFKINADCDANVSKYFEPYVKKVDDASFRGYPMKGMQVDFPEGYKGIVMHESIQPLTDKEERKFYVIHTFDKLMYWNWDKTPSKNDAFQKAMEWIDIADALHSPIIEE